MIEIDIFSDTICPWCFIGKRRLEQALAERPQPELVVRWRAFQLNPDMPPEGMERQSYLAAKFGGPGNAKAIYDRIRETGESVDLDFQFDRIERTPNTIDSHRLIRFAAGHDRQDEVTEALFQAYFMRGEDIGDRDVLTAAAMAAGLPAEETREFLDSGAFADVIREEDRQARHAGINGVPFFIFNRAHALSGAQPPEVFHQLFDLARESDLETAQH